MGGYLILDSKHEKFEHLISLKELDYYMISDLILSALSIKKAPLDYQNLLQGKTLTMFFEKPSLRTRVSFEAAIKQLGGHAIYVNSSETTFKQKESVSDTAKVLSRYCNIIMARLYKHDDIEEFAMNSRVPVINGLTDMFHPCQILADLMSIFEKKGKISGLKLSFIGDGNNNITHDLLLGCSAVGMDISVACPESAKPDPKIIELAKENAKSSGSEIAITSNPKKAVEYCDIVYADTWMSYHIPEKEKNERVKLFESFQVNKSLMKLARKDAIFMHCLPAERGHEVTANVIDGHQSIVFDQAENRLHMQKAIILSLLARNI